MKIFLKELYFEILLLLFFIFQINNKDQPEFSSESEDDEQPEKETSKKRAADSKCKQTVSKKVNIRVDIKRKTITILYYKIQ